MKATIVDLRYHMRNVLLAIERGETVTVLYRGKEKAKLVPIFPGSGGAGEGVAKTKDQPLFGLWKDRDDVADPASYLRQMRQPRPVLAETSGKRRPDAGKAK